MGQIRAVRQVVASGARAPEEVAAAFTSVRKGAVAEVLDVLAEMGLVPTEAA